VVLVYGEPRLTRDVDVTLGLTLKALPLVLSVADRIGLQVPVEDVGAFVQQTWALPTLHPPSGLRVDFIFSWTPYEQQAMARAREIEIEGYPVRFAAPEDVIIHKILAGRMRDLEDIRSILRKQAVDTDYIRQWLKAFSEALNQDVLSIFENIYGEVQAEL